MDIHEQTISELTNNDVNNSDSPNTKPILTPEQQLLILKRLDDKTKVPPSIMDLVKLVFPDIEPKLQDARSNYGRAIKEFLVSKDLKAIPLTLPRPELKEEDKEYIRNNCSSMKAFEMSKEIFKNQRLSPASNEAKLVTEYVRENIPKEALYDSEEDLDVTYRPPKSLDKVIVRINRYLRDVNFDIKKMSASTKKECMTLISYLNDYRFSRQIESYSNQNDKLLFESSFVKYCYDKSDLTQEELDQYIQLCAHIVMEFSIKSQLDRLISQEEQEWEINNKVSANLVDYIQSTREDLDKCVKRQQAFYKTLTKERGQRLSERIGQNASLLNLIETWRQKDSRDQMIAIANERRKKLSDEIDKLETLDDLKCKILGISKSEILDG